MKFFSLEKISGIVSDGTPLNIQTRDLDTKNGFIIQLNKKRKTYLYPGYGNNFVKTSNSAAIAELENSLQVLETNEPINRQEGNIEQADLEASNAQDFREAISKLKFAKHYEKTANLNEWLHNRKEDWDQFKYLAKHKYYVYQTGREMGAPRTQLLMHDWSKFKPSNWVPYREWFYGEGGVQGTKNPKVHERWRKAVKRHYETEPHHMHKINPEKIIPDNAKKEMLSDWYSLSEVTNPEGTPSFKSWVKKNPNRLDFYNRATDKNPKT